MNEQEDILVPELIEKISRNLEDLLSQGLKRNAIASLLRGMKGTNRMSRKQLDLVLYNLQHLKEHYIDPDQLKSKKSMNSLKK